MNLIRPKKIISLEYFIGMVVGTFLCLISVLIIRKWSLEIWGYSIPPQLNEQLYMWIFALIGLVFCFRWIVLKIISFILEKLIRNVK